MRARWSRWVVLLAGLAAVGGMLTSAGPPTPALVPAADLSQFHPGNIIADGVFYDTSSMTVQRIQSFLDSKGGSCTSGAYCLRNYRQSTYTRAATAACPRDYAGAANETAATIIYKVSQACGINPQVLIVTLQKEQGLVTATAPSASKYSAAMGYGCPDTPAGCDTTYNGLYNQLYMAARQFQLYRANPSRYGYRPGFTNSISYYPNRPTCGTQSVYIANQATAGLYNYTPYVPDQAALNAGYGSGGSCSSYGNRNFYNYFTDWFGSTQSSGGASVAAKYQALGGAGSFLGPATGDVTCALKDSGCWQPFQGGAIYWSPATGANSVHGDIYSTWARLGYENGVLGFPASDEVSIGGGAYTLFQGGAVYWSPATGSHFVRGAIYEAWARQGYETGTLGFPVSHETAIPGGAYSLFQGGAIYWSPASGARIIRGEVYSGWAARGYEGGSLGYPVTDVANVSGGSFSVFQKGAIYWSPTTGAFALQGADYTAWARQGYERGALGWPTSDEISVTGGTQQTFQGGVILNSRASGARIVTDPMVSAWRAAGGAAGTLGMPTADAVALRGGAMQLFSGGTLYFSPATGTHLMRGAIYGAWARLGYETGGLGYPTSDVRDVAGGQQADFQGGSIYSSPATGTHWLSGTLAAALTAQGGTATLGFPTTDQFTTATGGRAAHLQRGNLYWSASTGVHNVSGAFYTAWAALGYENGPLGYPTQDVTNSGGGQVLTFQNGAIYASPGTGTHAVTAPHAALYTQWGGPTGTLGFPTTDARSTTAGRSGTYQHFSGGSIYASANSGAHVVKGAIFTAWAAGGYEFGPLGFPVADETNVPGGAFSLFQGGAVYWSPAGGAHTIRGRFYDAWANAGYEGGALGFPTSDDYAVTGGRRMDFDHGHITVNAAGQATVSVP